MGIIDLLYNIESTSEHNLKDSKLMGSPYSGTKAKKL